MSVHLPRQLSSDQLKRLALTCGINKTGTKATLLQRLETAATESVPLGPDARILSVDLGIRNLAYALLTPGSLTPASPSPAPLSLRGKITAARPVVHAWTRIDLLAPPAAGLSSPSAPDNFSPAALSAVAVRLVRERLLPLRPTHVLIERQRFRSGGGAGVLEWTVRVNSLEAMLYASLATLRDLDRWEGQVVPIEPRRVGPFLLGDGGDGVDDAAGSSISPSRTGRKKAAESKRLKMDLLGRWLRDRESVELGNTEVRAVATAYLSRWDRAAAAAARSPEGKGRRPSVRSATSPQQEADEGDEEKAGPAALLKLDDLADCLLQGVAFTRWAANKQLLLEQGPGALLP